MESKHRDTEEIEKFCQQFRQFCDKVIAEATALKGMAASAEGSLRDEVGQRAILKVEEFSNELIRIVYQGEGPVLDLEKKNLQMLDDMESISKKMGR